MWCTERWTTSQAKPQQEAETCIKPQLDHAVMDSTVQQQATVSLGDSNLLLLVQGCQLDDSFSLSSQHKLSEASCCKERRV